MNDQEIEFWCAVRAGFVDALEPRALLTIVCDGLGVAWAPLTDKAQALALLEKYPMQMTPTPLGWRTPGWGHESTFSRMVCVVNAHRAKDRAGQSTTTATKG